MTFQMLPLALRKNTGSPLSKLLLIYLMHKADLPHMDDVGGWDCTSRTIELDVMTASDFCQCSEEDIYGACEELERLRIAYPPPQYVRNRVVNGPQDRYEFLVVGLPLSNIPVRDRSRIKASDDQIDAMASMAKYICPSCGVEDEYIAAWHVDHIIPRSRGGADVEENCQAICDRCNGRKSAKLHWVDFLSGRP